LSREAPGQTVFAFVPTVTPRGDGSYVVQPGKPQQWLWVRDAARMYQISPDAIREWILKGLVVSRRVGLLKYQVEASSLSTFIRPDNWRE
jgi:hypothetical protein